MKEKMKSHDRKKVGPGKSGRGLRSSDGRKNEAPDDTLTLQFVHGYVRYIRCMHSRCNCCLRFPM